MTAQNVLKKLVNNSVLAISDGVYDFEASLQRSDDSLARIMRTSQHAALITEIKFASPSLGKIRTVTNPVSIAKQMIRGGSKALSVLTQPHLFHGSPSYFMMIRDAVDVPLLMKDIIVDDIQIDAARKMGADYILLIQSLFDQGHIQEEIGEFIDYGHKQGLDILLEVHTKKELENALATNADLIGVNNRDLDTLHIDLRTTETVLTDFADARPVIAESGIQTPEDIRYLKRCGASAFLIGSSIMKSENITEHVRRLVNAY